MVFLRKIAEGGWFGKSSLDSDSISDLGTINHELSVWKVSNKNDISHVDDIALAMALTRTKIEEMYLIFLDLNIIEQKHKWKISLKDQAGDTRYTIMQNEHVNLILTSFWEQGFLAEYICDIVKSNSKDIIYYAVPKLEKLAYDAVFNKKLTLDDIEKTQWKKRVKELEKIYGAIP